MKRNWPLNWVMLNRESFRLLFSNSETLEEIKVFNLSSFIYTESLNCTWLLFKHDSQQKTYFPICPELNTPNLVYFMIFQDAPTWTSWRWRFLCITKPHWCRQCRRAWPRLMTTKPANNRHTNVLHDNTRPRRTDVTSHHTPHRNTHHTHIITSHTSAISTSFIIMQWHSWAGCTFTPHWLRTIFTFMLLADATCIR